MSSEVKPRAPTRTTCRYHCTSCDQHFSSLVAFDAHRTGPWGSRECRTPEEVFSARGKRLLGVQTSDGWCALQSSQWRSGVDIVEAQ